MSVRRRINRYKDMNPICETYEEALTKGKRLNSTWLAGDPYGGRYSARIDHSDFVVARSEFNGKVYWIPYGVLGRENEKFADGSKKVSWNSEKKRWIVSDWQKEEGMHNV